METKEQVRLSDEEVVALKERLEKTQAKYHRANEAKGFRKLTAGDKQKLSNKVQELAKQLADEYIARYKEQCEFFGMEWKAEMVPDPYTGAALARIMLRPYKKAEKPNVKPWHEAMAENLKVRADCEHVLHDEGNACEKCGLAPQNWGENGKGVSATYFSDMREKIEAEKKIQEEADAEDKREGR